MFSAIVLLVSSLVVFFSIRFFLLVYKVYCGFALYSNLGDVKKPVKVAVIIGSGGHTSEMLRLTQHLDRLKYSPRIYIMASSDKTSEVKVISQERTLGKSDYQIVRIPRSREVKQSYWTSILTTLHSVVMSVPVMLSQKPDLILCNGPGTCVPICFIAFLMRVFFISFNKIVFIESICRVKTLSLTGKILLFFADVVLVQWPDLQKRYPRTRYIGRL